MNHLLLTFYQSVYSDIHSSQFVYVFYFDLGDLFYFLYFRKCSLIKNLFQLTRLTYPIYFAENFHLMRYLAATNNFDESFALGEGGFAKVYKGRIDITLQQIKKSKSMSAELRKELQYKLPQLK